MHENRETSEAPAAQPGSRSAGEGESRAARAYVSEESHGGIVPMNHSNKDGNSLAESGEGRTPIKENVRQSNTYPTEREERVTGTGGRGAAMLAAILAGASPARGTCPVATV